MNTSVCDNDTDTRVVRCDEMLLEMSGAKSKSRISCFHLCPFLLYLYKKVQLVSFQGQDESMELVKRKLEGSKTVKNTVFHMASS